jgi:hypothetical protein
VLGEHGLHEGEAAGGKDGTQGDDAKGEGDSLDAREGGREGGRAGMKGGRGLRDGWREEAEGP